MRETLIVIGALLAVMGGCHMCRSCNDAAETAHKEFDASSLLKKYEYFKDLSAAIDKKRADIEVYRAELQDFKVENKEDKFYYEQRKSEAIGIVMIYNQLASDYNSQMAKFNWRFCNVGTLPASNLEPLPNAHAPYILKLK